MTRHLLDEVLDAKERKQGGRMDAITERVERGAALLDEKRVGWWREIDLGRLDIGSNCNCVGGQLSGGLCSFSVTMEDLDLDCEDEFIGHGFEAACGDSLIVEGEYAALTAAWRDLILRRRAAAEVSA